RRRFCVGLSPQWPRPGYRNHTRVDHLSSQSGDMLNRPTPPHSAGWNDLAMADVKLPVPSLLLDTDNPRHRKVSSQEEALAAILGRRPEKLVALAKHIVEKGLSP